MSKITDKLDSILSTFDGELGESDNPADAEFDRPENFPEVVSLPELISETKSIIENPDMGNDVEYLRKVYRHLIERGLITLEGAINIAKETENARALEVAGQLFNSVSLISEKLMKMHNEVQKNINQSNKGKIKEKTTEGTQVQNNYYILDKDKNAKDILNDLINNAIEGECVDVTPSNNNKKDEQK
jgi:hypothetical protein